MIKKILLVILILFFMGCSVCAGYVVMVIHNNASDIDTSDIYSLVNQRSTLYDDEGKKIEDLYFAGGNRDIVEYSQMPKSMVDAIISIEDRTFWDHHGFNVVRMIGAVKEKLFGGGQISGTSTITQQLARNIYLADKKSERTIERKLVEAWYAVQLERTMTKEQIMEAYLNTVYFGFDSYGIEAAADNYFSKHASELTPAECVALAALPQSPDVYALVRYKENGDTEYNLEASAERRALVLSQMLENGYITADEKAQIESEDLKKLIKLHDRQTSVASYYTDYAIEQVAEDLAEETGRTKEEAKQMIYTKGLSIYTCLDQDMQKVLDEEINNSSNYTGISYYNTDGDGNILNKRGSVIARPYSSYFTDKGTFKLKKSEYRKNDDGSLTILKGKRLALYDTGSGVTIGFRTLYKKKDGALCLLEGGGLAVPEEYTSFDSEENCVVSAEFIKQNPDFFVYDDDKVKIKRENITFGQEMKQPQAAAAIMENVSGQIKAMSGGRGSSGKQLYNRAIHPRQPGSSIKPIAVYGPALQLSAEAAQDGRAMSLDNSGGNSFGNYITAGSIINDAAVTVNGRVWPRNSYGGYRGRMTLRKGVQQSVNVVAYKVFKQIGEEDSIKMLKKVGVTTVDEEGDTSDLNPAALALGGMTVGISPLEMTAAYAVFPNGGIYKRPQMYTKVLDSRGDVLLEGVTREERVYDEGVAFIMTDILQGVVTRGTGTNARIGTQPVGGKTGTTSDQYDIWFAGFTPEYSMALWEGNDVNIALTSMSSAAASFWGKIMGRVCTQSASFRPKPDNVVQIKGEYYVDGTYGGVQYKEDSKKKKKEDKDDDGEGLDYNGSPASTQSPSPAPKKQTTPTKGNWEDEFDWD